MRRLVPLTESERATIADALDAVGEQISGRASDRVVGLYRQLCSLLWLPPTESDDEERGPLQQEEIDAALARLEQVIQLINGRVPAATIDVATKLLRRLSLQVGS